MCAREGAYSRKHGKVCKGHIQKCLTFLNVPWIAWCLGLLCGLCLAAAGEPNSRLAPLSENAPDFGDILCKSLALFHSLPRGKDLEFSTWEKKQYLDQIEQWKWKHTVSLQGQAKSCFC